MGLGHLGLLLCGIPDRLVRRPFVGATLYLCWAVIAWRKSFHHEEMCQTSPTFAYFLNACDFLESSILLKARITILKFLNGRGFYGMFKCGRIDWCSEASYWYWVRSFQHAVNRVTYNSWSSNLLLVVGKSITWDDSLQGVNREGWSRPLATAMREKELWNVVGPHEFQCGNE